MILLKKINSNLRSCANFFRVNFKAMAKNKIKFKVRAQKIFFPDLKLKCNTKC